MSRGAPRCNPACLNGGTCLRSPSGPVCVCSGTYSGNYCEISASDRTTYIIIAVVLGIGLFLTLVIYVIRCCKNEPVQQTTRPSAPPQMVRRIISVHAQDSIKIDRTNDEAPPDYDDVTESSQNITEEDLTDTGIEGLESTDPEQLGMDNAQFDEDTTNCYINIIMDDGSSVIDNVVQDSAGDQIESKSSLECVVPVPPSYLLVQKNRASQHSRYSPDPDDTLQDDETLE